MKVVQIIVMLLFSLNLSAQNTKTLLDSAEVLAQNGNHSKALSILEDVIKDDVHAWKAYYFRASIYRAKGDGNKALEYYTEAINNFPNQLALRNGRGELFLAAKLFDNAIEDFDYAINKDPKDSLKVALLTNRGSAKNAKRDHQGAYDDYMLAYEIDSLSIGVLNNLGAVCDEVGRGDETIKYLLKVLEIDSTVFQAIGNLGYKYQVAGNHKEAIKYFNKVLDMIPNEPYAYNNRAFSKLKLGDLKGALEDVEKSLSLNSTNSFAYKNKALILIEMGEKKKACKALQAALDNQFTEMYGIEVEELMIVNCN